MKKLSVSLVTLLLAMGLTACGGGGGSKMPDIYQDRPAPQGESDGSTTPPPAEPQPEDSPSFTVPTSPGQTIETPVLEGTENPAPIAEETEIAVIRHNVDGRGPYLLVLRICSGARVVNDGDVAASET